MSGLATRLRGSRRLSLRRRKPAFELDMKHDQPASRTVLPDPHRAAATYQRGTQKTCVACVKPCVLRVRADPGAENRAQQETEKSRQAERNVRMILVRAAHRCRLLVGWIRMGYSSCVKAIARSCAAVLRRRSFRTTGSCRPGSVHSQRRCKVNPRNRSE